MLGSISLLPADNWMKLYLCPAQHLAPPGTSATLHSTPEWCPYQRATALSHQCLLSHSFLPTPSTLSSWFFSGWTRCRPHQHEGLVNRHSPLMSFPSCLHPSKKGYLILPETSWWYLTFCGLIFSQPVFAIPSSLVFLSVPGILIYFEKALSTVSFLLHKLINNSVQPSSGSNNISLLLTQPPTSVLP